MNGCGHRASICCRPTRPFILHRRGVSYRGRSHHVAPDGRVYMAVPPGRWRRTQPLARYGAGESEEEDEVVKYATIQPHLEDCRMSLSLLSQMRLEHLHGIEAVMSRHRHKVSNGCDLKVVFKTVDSCFDAIVGLEVIGYPDACILIDDVKLFTSSISDKNPLLVVLLVYTPEITLFFDRRDESTTATISFKGVCMHGPWGEG